jgi:hypothetical protein
VRLATLSLIAVAALAAPAAASASTGFPDRESDPVVLDGSDVPALLGAEPGRVVAFSFDGGWHQVPVQVDERAMIDYAAVRGGYQTGGRPFSHLAYTDPGTRAGPDPDPSRDADDEIAAMAMDTGDPADPGASDPAGVVAGSRVPVTVTDPLQPDVSRYLYLFRSEGGLDPAAGRSYVKYAFKLQSGDYSTYDFDGIPNADSTQSGPPGNPEDSVVDTDYYREHLLSRWISDELNVRAPGSTGVDILDGDKAQVAYGCGRSEVTFSRGGGGFIANKSGPVRAIRSYIGANSGTYTQRDQIYYQRREVDNTYLRVHPGISNIAQYLDYSSAAAGMTYRNSTVPAGATIDSTPDPALETGTTQGPPYTWEQVTGPQGTLSVINRMTTNMPGVVVGSYYEDTATPAASQCSSYADSQAWGASGSAITNAGQNTDPTLDGTYGPHYDFTASRSIFFSGPGADGALAARRSQQVDQPLEVGTATPNLRVRGPQGPRGAKIGQKKALGIRITNMGSVATGPIGVCISGKRKLVRAYHCRTIHNLQPGHTAVAGPKLKLRPKAADQHLVRVDVDTTAANFEARTRVKLKPKG